MNISRREFLVAAGAAGIAIPALAAVDGIQIGVCVSTRELDDVVRYGFDYIEPAAASIAEMSDASFQAFKSKLMASPIRCECYNSFIRRKDLRVVGDDVNWDALNVYLDHTLARCRELGGSIVVWGSSGSRNVAPGYSREKAWGQIKEFLGRAGEIAHDVQEESFQRLGEARAEKGVNYQRGILELRLQTAPRFGIRRHFRGAGFGEAPQIGGGVSLDLPGLRKQNHARGEAALAQQPRNNHAVAAVVAPAAEDDALLRAQRRETLLEKLHDAPPGIFHQRQAGHAILLRRQPVNALHFMGGENLHHLDSRQIFQRLEVLRISHGNEVITRNNLPVGLGIEFELMGFVADRQDDDSQPVAAIRLPCRALPAAGRSARSCL